MFKPIQRGDVTIDRRDVTIDRRDVTMDRRDMTMDRRDMTMDRRHRAHHPKVRHLLIRVHCSSEDAAAYF